MTWGEAYLAEVNHSLVNAQPQRQQRNAQAKLLLTALALPRPHRLQLNLHASAHPSALGAICAPSKCIPCALMECNPTYTSHVLA